MRFSRLAVLLASLTGLSPIWGQGTPQMFSITGASASTTPGGTVTANVSVTPLSGSGFSAPVTLCYWCGTKPGTPGVSVTFSPASVSPGSSWVATIAVGGGVVPGSYTLPIGGTAAGSGMVYGTIALTVNAASAVPGFTLGAVPAATIAAGYNYSGYTSMVINPQNGFNSAVTVTGVGLPAGLQIGGQSQYPYSDTYAIPMGIAVAPSVPPGQYTITLNATGGSVTQSTTFQLTITPYAEGSAYSIRGASIALPRGGGGSVTVPINGTTPLTLSTDAWMPGINATFTPNSPPSIDQTANVTVASAVPSGSYSYMQDRKSTRLNSSHRH